MSVDDKAQVTEGTRQLTALEGAVRELLKEAETGKLDPAMATIKGDILASLWKDGNATLLRLEAQTGPHPRRTTFVEAYAAARYALQKLRVSECSATPPMDITLTSVAARSDHLPRIELPKFNGSPSEWPAFAGRFEKRVAGLTEEADRYAFLLKCFERCDIARNSFEAFENAGMPFQQAWKKLEERFYKKRVVFLEHFQQILDLPKMTVASANGLMRIIDVVETSTASSRQIAGEMNAKPTVIEDGLLVSIVLSKLDTETAERIARQSDVQRIPTWKELREELDRLPNQIYYGPKKKEVPRTHTSFAPTRPARTVLSATVRPAVSKPPVTTPSPATGTSAANGIWGPRRCYACDKTGHVGTLCPELRVRSAIERLNFIMGQGKCINCLSRQHKSAECPSGKRCQTCQKRHHTLLHVENEATLAIK
uniref:CCHC-type domain-containing protein n=1 Tax=Anopheles dirus TaxID=7168 RepID=A0A182NPX5_9DIPT